MSHFVKSSDRKHTDQGFFDDAFFDELLEAERQRIEAKKAALDVGSETIEISLVINASDSNRRFANSGDFNAIDEQYFGEYVRDNLGTGITEKSNASPGHNMDVQTNALKSDQSSEGHFGHIDSQYFGTKEHVSSSFSDSSNTLLTESKPAHRTKGADYEDLNYFDQTLVGAETSSEKDRSLGSENTYEKESNLSKPSVATSSSTGRGKHADRTSATLRSQPTTDRISATEGDASINQVKRYGKSVLNKLVPDLDQQPGYCIVDLLVDGKIYEDDGAQLYHSISKYLPEIAKRLKFDGTLYLCHRLDKNVTGAVLIAKGQEQSVQIKKKFEQGLIYKSYTAITKGVPNPKLGKIDIPIATESIVNESYRSILVSHDTKTRRRGVYSAQTTYEVVRHNLTAAVVELTPTTGRKHQLRVHLADGLNTPILGDHKYSFRNRMAPQRLPGDMLAKLQLEQSEVRSLPMHLHARKLVVPDYFKGGKELTLTASLPKFFRRTISLLKLSR